MVQKSFFLINICCCELLYNSQLNRFFLKRERIENASFFRKERIPKTEEIIPMIVHTSINTNVQNKICPFEVLYTFDYECYINMLKDSNRIIVFCPSNIQFKMGKTQENGGLQ